MRPIAYFTSLMCFASLAACFTEDRAAARPDYPGEVDEPRDTGGDTGPSDTAEVAPGDTISPDTTPPDTISPDTAPSDAADVPVEVVDPNLLTGSGATATWRITPAGGSFELEEISLVVPAGAVSAAVDVVVTEVAGVASGPFDFASPIYTFSPPLALSTAAVAELGFAGDGGLVDLFVAQTATGAKERAFAEVAGGVATGELLSASLLFASATSRFEEVADPTCAKVRSGKSKTLTPGGVSYAFGVADCDGRAVTGLELADLRVVESDADISAGLPGRVAAAAPMTVVTIVVDIGTSDAGRVAAMEAALIEFVGALEASGLQIAVAVQLFDSGADVTRWINVSPRLDSVATSLSELSAQPLGGSARNNVWGAAAAGLSLVNAARTEYDTRNFNGAVTRGIALVIADGVDTSGLVTPTDVTSLTVGADSWMLLALDTPAEDFGVHSASWVRTTAADGLRRELQAAANRIIATASAWYRLDYCTTARSGVRTLRVDVSAAGDQGSDSATFNANRLEDGCAVGDFDAACASFECGGHLCGGCDERTTSCVSNPGVCAVN